MVQSRSLVEERSTEQGWCIRRCRRRSTHTLMGIWWCQVLLRLQEQDPFISLAEDQLISLSRDTRPRLWCAPSPTPSSASPLHTQPLFSWIPKLHLALGRENLARERGRNRDPLFFSFFPSSSFTMAVYPSMRKPLLEFPSPSSKFRHTSFRLVFA